MFLSFSSIIYPKIRDMNNVSSGVMIFEKVVDEKSNLSNILDNNVEISHHTLIFVSLARFLLLLWRKGYASLCLTIYSLQNALKPWFII